MATAAINDCDVEHVSGVDYDNTVEPDSRTKRIKTQALRLDRFIEL